jgi:hypothetical protein
MGTQEYPMRTLEVARPYLFSPRLGVAWQFLPKTVLRAGYGINRMSQSGLPSLGGTPYDLVG